MKRIYLTLIIILASAFHVFAAIDKSSNKWTATTISQNRTIEFDSNSPEAITLSGTITINAGCKLTIQNNSGKTITITKTSNSSMFSVTGELEIIGSENHHIVLDGGADYTFSERDYSLTPNASRTGRCITSKGYLYVKNVTIRNFNNYTGDGGAIHLSTTKQTILDSCLIQKCTAWRGSAIIINANNTNPDASAVKIQNSTITQCVTGGHSRSDQNNCGGAIRTFAGVSSNLYLTNVTMSWNYSRREDDEFLTNPHELYHDGNGGALFWNGRKKDNTTCYIDGCTFEYNKCDDNGGAIKAQGSIEFCNNITKIKNNAAPLGAGLFIEGYTGNVTTGVSSIRYDLNEFLEITENQAVSYTDHNGATASGKGAGIYFDFGQLMTLKEESTITVDLNGAKINNNHSDNNNGLGGGIYYEENSKDVKNYNFYIYLNHGEVTNNSASLNGGGIYVSKGDVTYNNIENGKSLIVSGNSAASGAGIYIKGGSLEMAHGTITDNYTTGSGNGGGIYIENGDFTIKDGEISGNSVNNGNGGGVYILGSKEGDKITGNFTMDGSGSIKDNSASGNGKNVGFGGGIYVNGGNFTLTENATDGEISNNSSTQDGGGVYINGGQFIQKKGDISSNTSGGNGGGVCIVNGGTFTMSGGMITANGKEGQTIHTQNGGGVYLNGGNFVLENGTISNNGAAVNGGGVFLTGENCTYQLQKGDITGNSAGNGGGVYLEKGLFKLGTSGNILDGNISNNAAQFGGGVYIGSGSTSSVSDDASDEPTEGFIMYGGKITGNSTTDDGGGIYLNGGSFLMYNGDIISNSSLTVGGGVCIANNGNLTMNNGNITQNGLKTGTVVTENGGGVYLDGGSLTVNAGNISENSATASGGGVYISNGNVGMQTGKILSNSCGEYGGGIYVYNPVGSTSKTVSVTGGSLLENTAKYGGGICVDGLIVLTIGNVEIAENTATNGGGVCLMNNADMIFGAGQIKNNKAVKSESSQIYTGVTGFEKDIETVEGLGGGLYLNSNTTLVFSDATELGLFGNTADNGADEIFANGSGTSVILPDVTGMKLDGYPGAGNLKWIEDYITNDTGYASGTKLKGQRWDEEKTNIRYRNAISNNDQDNIFNLEKGTTEDDRTKYICFALGYEVIYVTITRHGLADGESAVYTLSKSGTDESENFSVMLTGNGQESVSKKVAVTAGVWTVKEEHWNWTYDFTPVNDLLGYVPDEENKEEIEDGDIVVDDSNRLIQKNIAKSFNRNFIFQGNKRQGLPMNAEAIVVNVMGN